MENGLWKPSVIGLGKKQGKLSEILALQPYHGKLYAGTYPYAKVFEFDGNSWTPEFGYPDENMHVYSLAVFKDKLFIGFDKGAGIWSFDGNELTQEFQNKFVSNVYSLTVANNKLYGGSMGLGDGQANVMEFDGNYWKGIGFSDDLNCSNFPPDNIFSIANFNGKLFAGSSTPGFKGCALVYENGKWINSKTFSDYTVYSLQQFQGKLYAGLMPSGKIQVFDGSEWKQMPS